MTSPPRWEPDQHLVDAVLSSPKASRRMTELSNPDRAWLVAGLTLAGLTAKDIADRLGCSLRLVRCIRADPMTQMCDLWLASQKAAADDLRAERLNHMATRGDLNHARAEANRYRVQLDQAVGHMINGERVELFGKCQHPKVRYNVYWHGGREHCRECHRDRQARYRAAKRNGSTCTMLQPQHDSPLSNVGA